MRLNAKAEAQRVFTHIKERYPGTREAKLATAYLTSPELFSKQNKIAVTSDKTKAAPKTLSNLEKLKQLIKERSITEAEWKELPAKSRIPYSHEEGHLKVNAKINGRDVKMIFDTGASICSLSTADYPDLFSRATLSKAQPVPIRRPHGFTEGRLCQVDLTVHDITRRVSILATSEPGVTLVGQNFFKEYSYMIDPFYIRLTKAPYRPPEEIIANISKDPNKIEKSASKVESKTTNPQDRWKLPFQRMGELMMVDMEVNGHKVKACFDTGCAVDGIVIPPQFYKPLGIKLGGGGRQQVADKVVVGPIQKRYVRVHFAAALHFLLIGPKIFDRPYTVDQKESCIVFDY